MAVRGRGGSQQEELGMGKVGKAVGVLIALGLLVILFVVPTMIAMKTWLVWKVFWGYVEGVSNLTGLNQYLLTALALVLLVPFYIGADMLFSFRGLWSRRWRYTGAAILLAMAVGYNLSLYYVTKEMAFAFAGGAAQKWYAITPKGVKYYDRPGFDTEYGTALQPVTPEIVVKLKLLEKGEFTPIDPSQKPLFNPITGQAQAWYYQYPDGRFEFYDKPGFHPVTGAPLKAVTDQVYFEWRKTQKARPPEGVVREPRSRTEPSTGGQPSAAVVQIRSDPPGADTYLDWKPQGQTPVPIEGKEIRGLLVVVKEGHRAGFRRIDAREEGGVEFTLPPDAPRTRTRLLVVAEGTAADAFSSLRSRLVEEGFTVLGEEEAREFQREVRRAGGLSHRGLRAWARARFDTDLLVTARVRQSSRELSGQELGYLGIREAVKGAVRAEVGIDLEVVDLRSGDHLAAASGKGSGFALDRAQGFQKALTQAATESAKLLRERIRG